MTEKEAVKSLKAAGWVLLPGNRWRLPSPDYEVTAAQISLVNELVSTGDYEGFETRWMIQGAAAFHAGVSCKANPYSHTYECGRARLEWSWGWEMEQQAWVEDRKVGER